MKFRFLSLILFFTMSQLIVFGQSSTSKINWENPDWIGYTKDNRLEKWSTRDFVRNQPPMNINTWQPTEKELKAVQRKAHPSILLRKSFSVAKEIVLSVDVSLSTIHFNACF